VTHNGIYSDPDTLIKEIEDKRDHVIATFAGYEDETEHFFDTNP